MKKITLSILGLLFMQLSYAIHSPHFTSTPSLSPDGKDAYFSYDGDIWKVSVQGGEALRITALEGEESRPRVSPNGKYLTFTSNQFGNEDVFLLSFEDGQVRQLTFHQAKDEVESWSWDSKKIYFTSNRYNNFGSFEVSIDGGTARPLFTNYFNNANGLVQSPDGSYIFTSSMESSSQISRKRYKGANNPDLLSYNPQSNSFKKLTTYIGKDFHPSVDQDGNIYYISDEVNDHYNLYVLKNGIKTALTSFESSIKSPYVSANGKQVIFEKDYQLFIYDVANKQSSAISFTAAAQNRLGKEQAFKIDKEISYFDVSPDGHKIAFVSRGVLFVSDIKGKFIQEIHNGPERVSEVKWLKDNQTLLFNQTYKGYQNLFTISARGSGNLKQVTFDERSNRDIQINLDYTQAVYLSGRDEVRILDLSSLQSKTIVQDEIWAFQNSSPQFSPNGDYVLYTAVRNFEKDIFVHHIAQNKTINLTKTGISEIDPYWSPDGKYIYFASNRTEPAYPFGMSNARIYRFGLDWFTKDFKSDEFQKLFDIKDQDLDEEEAKKKKKKKEKAALEKEQQESITINMDGLSERITLVTNNYGNQFYPTIFRIKDKDHIFYNSNEGPNKNVFYKTVFNDFEKPKHEQAHDKKVDLFIQRKEKFYFLSEKQLYTYEEDKNKVEKIDLKHSFFKNFYTEFHQMFEETWAGIEENFYDENFHGVDWNSTKDQFKTYLPYVKSRNDLRVLLNDMLGELNASHLGFSSQGKEEKKLLNYHTHETGIVFNPENPYQVERVIRKSPAFRSGVDIEKGDILIAVNGKKVNFEMDRDLYFTSPKALEELHLTFDRNGKEIKVKMHPISNAVLKSLLYDEWILDNKNKVKELSQDRIAYSYMKNMTGSQLESFLLDMVSEENNREALILDLRFNTGGNVHDKVLNFLAQRPYLNWKYREGQKTAQSNFAPAAKPIVLLINEASLSDAEMTAAGFKALQLGKIIGTETYRWIIFTSSKRLVDGSGFRVPAWGCFTLEGENLELTGVKPDIEIENTFFDRLHNKDPQLERAIKEIMKEL